MAPPTPRRRTRCLSAQLALACALLAGCPGGAKDGAPEPATTDAARAAHTEALVRRANNDAFQRLLPLAADAFGLENPALVPGGALSMPPLTASRREALRQAMEAALRENDGIKASLLEPQQAALLLAIRFGLNRIRDHLTERRPWRTDPNWVTDRAARVARRLVMRAATGDCEQCAAALQPLADEVTAGVAGLAACSPATARAAETSLRTSIAAIEGALADASAARPAVAQLHTAAVRLGAVAAAVAEKKAGDATYAKPGAPGRSPSHVRRLPDAVGRDELRRRLEVEENLSTPPGMLYRSFGATLVQLSRIAQRHKPSAPAAQTPVDAARCSALLAGLDAFAKALEARPAVAKSCADLAASLPPRATDAELTMFLVDHAMIDPLWATRRAAQGPVLGRLAGRVTGGSGRHTFRLGIAMSYGDGPSTHLAAQDAWDATCAAAAALWIHGDLGPDDELRTQLGKQCGQQPADAWVDRAKANPRAALDGIAVAWLARGPASVVLLERLWWLPLGLVGPLSDPTLLRAPDVPVEVHVAPLGPRQKTPSGDAAPKGAPP